MTLTHQSKESVAFTYTDTTALIHCTAYFFFPPNDIFSVFFFCASLNKRHTFTLASGLMVCVCMHECVCVCFVHTSLVELVFICASVSVSVCSRCTCLTMFCACVWFLLCVCVCVKATYRGEQPAVMSHGCRSRAAAD